MSRFFVFMRGSHGAMGPYSRSAASTSADPIGSLSANTSLDERRSSVLMRMASCPVVPVRSEAFLQPLPVSLPFPPRAGAALPSSSPVLRATGRSHARRVLPDAAAGRPDPLRAAPPRRSAHAGSQARPASPAARATSRRPHRGARPSRPVAPGLPRPARCVRPRNLPPGPSAPSRDLRQTGGRPTARDRHLPGAGATT